MRYILLIFSILTITTTSLAQRNSQQYFDPLSDDITQYIPPLSALVDSAVANAPSVQFENLKTDFYRYNVKTAKRDIYEHLGFNGEINNGRFYFNDYNQLQDADFYRSESRRFNYLVGVYLKLPLSSIIDRRNRINKEKKWVEISMARQREVEKQIRREVIRLYNDLIESQRILKISNDYLQWTYAQMKMAENQFVNGQISVAEITRLKEFQRRGQTEFEKQRASFKSAYDQLQALVGMKFNKIKGLD
ncbi:MAG: TolC family protein [Bacteroidales bacterium]|nr:TolC family protein [Bacteroidales bacterium]MCF8333046.1 TolC family protein [Bacteroidales bacterium]